MRSRLRSKSGRNTRSALIGFLAALGVAASVWIPQTGHHLMAATHDVATFAGGCFWGIEKIFGELKGVISTRVGYTGGTTVNPTYEHVCTGRTGHAEAMEVMYDPAQVSYEELVEFFFTHHDPTTLNRQGNDIGTQYRSAIFYHTPQQQAAAERAKAALAAARVFEEPVTTTIEPAGPFYPAEAYHQRYLQKNPHGYCHILLQSSDVRDVLRAARHAPTGQ